jgi:peptidoglycan/LPS O-acetylase OafA/YrhL
VVRQQPDRRYDVDWLRVVAVFAVIALHSAVIFSWGLVNIKHVQHTLTVDAIDIFLSVWIIPLLFVLAGAATKFGLERRTPHAYRAERARRLLVPAIAFFALPAIVVNAFGWDFLTHLPGNARLAFTAIGTGHLWFVLYLYAFSMVALPLFLYLRTQVGAQVITWCAALCAKPGVIFLLALPVLGIAPADNDNDILKIFYIIYFIYGFVIFSDARFGQAIYKQAWYALAAGIALTVLIVVMAETHTQIDGLAGRFMEVFNRWCWVIAFLGLGQRFLNRTNGALQYLAEASYPIYILHFVILSLIGYAIAGLPWSVELKYLAILLLTVAVTVLTYDLVVKRTNVTRFLFGMKPKKSVSPVASV